MSSREDLVQRIRDWLKLVLSWPDAQVVMSEDEETAAARTEGPYVTVDLVADDSPMSTPYVRTTNEDAGGGAVWQYHSLQRVGQLSLEFFRPGAADFAMAIELSMGRDDVNEVLGDDTNVAMAGGVADQPVLRSTEREPAASLGFVVEWVDSTRVAVDPANGIEVELDATEGVEE